jgi:hypothetical protein
MTLGKWTDSWAGVPTLAVLLLACGGDDDPTFDPSAGGAGGSEEGGMASGGTTISSAGVAGAGSCSQPGGHFITEVVSVSYGAGQSFGQQLMPMVVYGPPRGGGCCTGSTDVVSLGNGGAVVVGFGPWSIVDGPGPDFVVFENAFEGPQGIFAEVATVEVSDDGENWTAFPCTATEPPWGSCAGYHSVLLDGDSGPLDPETSGGDPFDLADIGLATARYLRLVDRPDLEGLDGVFDLDAVGIVNAVCH